jgi:hypothetical protein
MSHESDHLRWFHVILTTYGAWLPGDARGFRTRDHRDHVDGDYKRPPEAGVYERFHDKNRASQKYPLVSFTPIQRNFVMQAIHERLALFGDPVAIVAVNARHAHLLLKLPPAETRHRVGMIKRHVTFSLRKLQWSGPVWAGGAKFVPIRDRQHQLNAYQYIADHIEEGGAVWKHGDPPPHDVPGDAVAGL